MKIKTTGIKGLIVFERQMFSDNRGYFYESFNKTWFDSLKLDIGFWQDNVSFSKEGVLRGLHFQKNPFAQAKLVQVLQGEVFDVALDLRKDSPTYRQWHAEILSESNGRMMFIPEGFAHGFLVISESALFHYKCSKKYSPENSITIFWDSASIFWPKQPKCISEQDEKGKTLDEYERETK
jgi:dTDP-4-dehydrorhamnose 3,5-epimerase